MGVGILLQYVSETRNCQFLCHARYYAGAGYICTIMSYTVDFSFTHKKRPANHNILAIQANEGFIGALARSRDVVIITIRILRNCACLWHPFYPFSSLRRHVKKVSNTNGLRVSKGKYPFPLQTRCRSSGRMVLGQKHIRGNSLPLVRVAPSYFQDKSHFTI